VKRIDTQQSFVTALSRRAPGASRRRARGLEVGEVRGGAVRLEEAVIPAGTDAGLEPVLVLINQQTFTKTANCWGVANNAKGTNSNRIVLFRKSNSQPPTPNSQDGILERSG
jgi:hypothetical protein